MERAFICLIHYKAATAGHGFSRAAKASQQIVIPNERELSWRSERDVRDLGPR